MGPARGSRAARPVRADRRSAGVDRRALRRYGEDRGPRAHHRADPNRLRRSAPRARAACRRRRGARSRRAARETAADRSRGSSLGGRAVPFGRPPTRAGRQGRQAHRRRHPAPGAREVRGVALAVERLAGSRPRGSRRRAASAHGG